jgi:hypothetical protein
MHLNPKGLFAGDVTLGILFLNRTVGLLMLVAGCVCGWVVAQSFSTAKWSEGAATAPTKA